MFLDAVVCSSAQEGTWTTGQDTKEKMQIREEAAKKRERAMAYAFSQQVYYCPVESFELRPSMGTAGTLHCERSDGFITILQQFCF